MLIGVVLELALNGVTGEIVSITLIGAGVVLASIVLYLDIAAGSQPSEARRDGALDPSDARRELQARRAAAERSLALERERQQQRERHEQVAKRAEEDAVGHRRTHPRPPRRPV